MQNIKLTLSFDGSAYHGSQLQNNNITIEEKFKKAWQKAFLEEIHPNSCSRTDAGVHALQFVMNIYTDILVETEKIPYILNLNLPDDIVVISAQSIDSSFHARFHAYKKKYIYKIYNTQLRNPFFERYAWNIREKLEIGKMQEASKAFIGKHDFKSFTAVESEYESTLREIFDVGVENEDELLTINITGDGFLYNMARIIVGTLVYAGLQKPGYDDMQKIIQSKNRLCAGITAPAKGLYLAEVFY